MMKFADIKAMDEKSIVTKIDELRRELFNFRLQKTTTGIEKSHLYKNTKKTIARLNTALNDKRES